MTYKSGIIGTGGIAGMGILGMHDESEVSQKKVHASHAGGYSGTEGIDLNAVADIDPEKLGRFGDAWEIPESGRYLGHEAMLANDDLDIVSVCTPTSIDNTSSMPLSRRWIPPQSGRRNRLPPPSLMPTK